MLLTYSAVIAATGGIDVMLAGVRIRSRTWQRPAAIGLACVAFVAVADRRRALAAARDAAGGAGRGWATVIRATSPRVLAGAAAAWALLAGVAFGTYVAGGADSSGYLNQATLFSRGRVVEDSRASANPPGADPLYKVSPLGYRPAAGGVRLAPTYPPGYPMLMAPAFLVDERAAFLVVPLCGLVAVWLTFALGRRLGHAAAGAAAAVLLSASPTFLYQLVQPMSDVPATAAWLLALYFATANGTSRAALSGVAAGIAVLIRPNLAPLAALVWAASATADSSVHRWRRAAVAMLATVPAVLTLALIQSIRYGSPAASGYGSMRDLFGWANVMPNLDRYPRWMFETHTPLIALFLLAPLWILRQRGARGLLLILWAFAVSVVFAYLPYVYFQPFEWTYTRFLLPAIPVMWLLILMPSLDILRRGRPALGMLVVVAVAVALVTFSIVVARNRFVFDLRTGEQKYVFSADYVRQRLPDNAVLIAMQHSGSLWFYTSRPILRWDYIEPRRLDETIAWAAGRGYVPFLVVDGEEMDRISERFGTAAPRALQRAKPLGHFGDVTVYGFD